MNPDERRAARAAEQDDALAEQRRQAIEARTERPATVIGTPLHDALADPDEAA